MERGRGNVEFEDLSPGTGPVATCHHQARVNCTISLNHGDVLSNSKDYWIDLARRHSAIAGLRYGIEGMQVGARRRIVVPPHLGYADDGAPDAGIPPKALLLCEVELLELRPSNMSQPKDA